MTFYSGGEAARVAGFGLDFLDVDFAFIQQSSLSIFSSAGAQLTIGFVPQGLNGSVQFLGFVTVDSDSGLPVPEISRAHILNGQGWPPTAPGEGVPLDNFAFSAPTPVPEPEHYAAAVGAMLVAVALARRWLGNRWC